MSKIYSTYGLLTAGLLIAYFLLIRLIGWHQYPILSSANGIIFGIGIYLAITKFRNQFKEEKYEKGFQVGLVCGIIATVVFTIFMAIYMYQLDTEFAYNIMEQWNMEEDLGTFTLLITISLMGIATSLILTFSFMQLLKTSWNTKDGNRNTL